MVKDIALGIVRLVQLGIFGIGFVPQFLYHRSRAARIFAHELRTTGIPEPAVQELTMQYKNMIKDVIRDK